MKNKTYLSLGSNMGDRAENIFCALSVLQSSGFAEIKKISSFYETSAVGPKQRNFYNIAAEAETSLSCGDLLSLVKQSEALLGRKPSKKWSPRVIDIDILFYNDEITADTDCRFCGNAGNFAVVNCSLPLTIPHKEMQNRLFVLCPLNEIAGNFVHPVLNRKINAILKENRLTLKNQKVKIITI
jgi:2-amino-4-hydroxy-6-hydroxymethyldihydropteridine diphosphokinase